MASQTLTTSGLTAVIGDNAAADPHRGGYNGVWSLEHRLSTRSLFVPAYAGLNHEHIVSGEFENQNDIFFEPRRAPMTLNTISEREAELHQPPTPTFFLESWTRFSVAEPHYLDMDYRCRATQHVFNYGYIACFWASYMNAPIDKSLYFIGGLENQNQLWSQFCTQQHDLHSTLRGRDDDFEMQFAAGARDALYKNFSPMRFDKPLFYGYFDDLVFIAMFDSDDGRIRITHSPSGGGVNTALATANPAWDFQFLVPSYKINEVYRMRSRCVIRERCSRAEILGEYTRWKASLG